MIELSEIGSVRVLPPNLVEGPQVIKQVGESLEESILKDAVRMAKLESISGFPWWKVEYYLWLSQTGYRKLAEAHLGVNLATGEPVK